LFSDSRGLRFHLLLGEGSLGRCPGTRVRGLDRLVVHPKGDLDNLAVTALGLHSDGVRIRILDQPGELQSIRPRTLGWGREDEPRYLRAILMEAWLRRLAEWLPVSKIRASLLTVKTVAEVIGNLETASTISVGSSSLAVTLMTTGTLIGCLFEWEEMIVGWSLRTRFLRRTAARGVGG